MRCHVYNLVNQFLLFHFQDSSSSGIKGTILTPYHTSLAYSLYIKSNSSLFWFIKHALLKRYWYVQYLQSPFQGTLSTFTRTHTTFILWLHAPTLVSREGQTPKISCGGIKLLSCFSIFLKRKKHGKCSQPSQC